MRTNTVRAKLRRGETSIGTWLNFPDPTVACFMSQVGFDWLTVELEHSPTSYETAAAAIAIVAAHGVAPLVRVSFNTPENIKRVLDFGAWGVIVPMVNSADEARAVVASARYAPIGARTIGGQYHAASFGTDGATYYARANEEILVAVMAEHVLAIERADEIMQVPGIDMVFVGPNDLTHSMGLPPSFDSDDPRFEAALTHIVQTAKRHGIIPGIHVADAAMARKRLAQGFRFIAVASEIGMLMNKASEIAGALGLGKGGGPMVKY
jgi:4-hydroxy-2-oxoheptanedioate aldolase